ncbi:glycosyltransferase [Brachybacterium sp. AOP24-D1-21]|uniref:glycosyltransferase n=1 Tax=Brachybacterium sp. AOP24-D1-21 TaxID=3457711 RepID=UPI0040344368
MRICVVVGYFDLFSGYQEIGLVQALAKRHDVTVVAGNLVSPIFSDSHLERIDQLREYAAGEREEDGYVLIRLPSLEIRSMIFAPGVSRVIQGREPDLIIQVMPGQLLPALAAAATRNVRSQVLFGDNRAMWAGLPRWAQRLKYLIFAGSKGFLYRYSTRHADVVYGYTPDTLHRIRPFVGKAPMEVLPLSFNDSVFRFDEHLRSKMRESLGFAESDKVFLLAGKFKLEKRFIEFIRAFVRVSRFRSDLKLLVVGPTLSDLDAGVSADKDHWSAVRVLPFGSQQSLNEVFCASDVGVWPAMPAITIQQAMGTGLFVVLPENDLVGHLVKNVRSGMLVRDLEHFEGFSLESAISAWADSFDADRWERARLNRWLSSEALAERLVSRG